MVTINYHLYDLIETVIFFVTQIFYSCFPKQSNKHNNKSHIVVWYLQHSEKHCLRYKISPIQIKYNIKLNYSYGINPIHQFWGGNWNVIIYENSKFKFGAGDYLVRLMFHPYLVHISQSMYINYLTNILIHLI